MDEKLRQNVPVHNLQQNLNGRFSQKICVAAILIF